jgi:hypothetical protein
VRATIGEDREQDFDQLLSCKTATVASSLLLERTEGLGHRSSVRLEVDLDPMVHLGRAVPKIV